MKKALAALAIVLTLAAAACNKKQDATPPPKPKPTIDAKAVTVCIEVGGNFVRRPDFWCGDPHTSKGHVDGHRWAYPYNTENWAGKELPAVGEPLLAGWGFTSPPAGMEETLPPFIPEEGAVFKR